MREKKDPKKSKTEKQQQKKKKKSSSNSSWKFSLLDELLFWRTLVLDIPMQFYKKIHVHLGFFIVTSF